MPLNPMQIEALGMITRNMTAMASRIEAGVVAVCQRYSQEGASWAKQNKPWETQTGAAVKSLHGYVVRQGRISARISHGVFYGIYLEKRFNGKYAVLPGVIRRFQAPFYEDIKKVARAAPLGLAGPAKK